MRRIFIIIGFLIALVWVVFSSPEQEFRPAADQQQRLTFWGIYDVPDIYQPIIDSFERRNPSVIVDYRQFPNREEYFYVLDKQFEKNQGPDVFLFPAEDFEKYQTHINPTNTRIAEGFTPTVQEQLVANRLLFGLPLWMDTLMLYYNKRYYPDGIANAWYGFAEQTRDINIAGIATGRTDNLKYGWDILASLFMQKQVRLRGYPENAAFDTLEFFTRFAYPIDRYFNWSDTLNKDYPDDEVDSFAREKVAAIAGYSSVKDFVSLKIEQLDEQGLRHLEEDEVGVAAFPQLNPEDPRYLSQMMVVSVSLYSEFPNQAWDFVEVLTSPTNATYLYESTGRIPGRILEDFQPTSELQAVQLEQAAYSYLYPLTEDQKAILSPIIEKGLKDKRLLREVLDVEFP